MIGSGHGQITGGLLPWLLCKLIIQIVILSVLFPSCQLWSNYVFAFTSKCCLHLSRQKLERLERSRQEEGDNALTLTDSHLGEHAEEESEEAPPSEAPPLIDTSSVSSEEEQIIPGSRATLERAEAAAELAEMAEFFGVDGETPEGHTHGALDQRFAIIAGAGLMSDQVETIDDIYAAQGDSPETSDGESHSSEDTTKNMLDRLSDDFRRQLVVAEMQGNEPETHRLQQEIQRLHLQAAANDRLVARRYTRLNKAKPRRQITG